MPANCGGKGRSQEHPQKRAVRKARPVARQVHRLVHELQGEHGEGCASDAHAGALDGRRGPHEQSPKTRIEERRSGCLKREHQARRAQHEPEPIGHRPSVKWISPGTT